MTTFDFISLCSDVIGLSSPIAASIWSALFVKKALYTNKIKFLLNDKTSLFSYIISQFPNLDIRLNGEEVKKGTYFIDAAFVNTGRNDIDCRLAEKQISITIPNKYQWIDIKVLKSNNDLVVTPHIVSSNKIEFDIGLFKREECFRFDAVFELVALHNEESYNKFDKKEVEFSHRLLDTGNIEKIEDTEYKYESNLKRKLPARILSCLLCLLLPFGIEYVYDRNTEVSQIQYVVKKGDTLEVVNAASNFDSTITIRHLTSKTLDTLSVEDFNAQLKGVKIKREIRKVYELISTHTPFTFRLFQGLFLAIAIMLITNLIIEPLINDRKVKIIQRVLELNHI